LKEIFAEGDMRADVNNRKLLTITTQLVMQICYAEVRASSASLRRSVDYGELVSQMVVESAPRRIRRET